MGNFNDQLWGISLIAITCSSPVPFSWATKRTLDPAIAFLTGSRTATAQTRVPVVGHRITLIMGEGQQSLTHSEHANSNGGFLVDGFAARI